MTNRYGTLGPSPVDRDRERLAQDLQVLRAAAPRTWTRTPRQPSRWRRARLVLAHVLRPRTRLSL
ncbi:hypothetical protein GC722_05290 [Auraticoccus sp. F435]|uniref:Uncharacterized protein n=1 Tax=Auraticoccus cholistanensis TaxID=2656650 RepID=A0A6A9UV47_9ACTN|nr:hypothetical protein [Auraticoccus cholistanensis]MVA75444.1 hypothetical protein [Auraticoccus cholistanensis]